MDALSTLPRSWVERIFGRLHGVYGSQFSGKYHQGVMINGVDAGLENAMQVWAEELAGFADHAEAIKYALENVDPKFPPSAKEFAELARRAPRKSAPALEHKIDPEQLARGLEKLKAIEKSAAKSNDDPIAWARKPRSQKALEFVVELANDEEGEFSEILAKLRADGHVNGNTLKRRWDYASQVWVANGKQPG